MYRKGWQPRLTFSLLSKKQVPADRIRRRPRKKRGRARALIDIARIEALEDRTLLSNSTLPTLSPSQITALDTYVAAPDPSYQYSLNSKIVGPGYTDYVINMISQTWTPQPGVSEVWQHWLQVVVPTTVTSKTAVINIENGEALNNSATPPTTADAYTVQTATTLGAITVFLPTVPNEPETFPSLGETTQLTEDPLVAFTFQQFLNGDGTDWPILLPMVKSVVRTMDTTQSFVASESNGALTVNNFIITGQSKRGWTTWLTPAVDTRIIAIVPYVFDGLNLPDQVESQLDTYVGVTEDTANGDSTAVEPYTTTFDQLDTPQGQSLLSIIDPLDYVNRPTYDIPKYMIDSTGDQFFVPDAQFFFSDLPGENYLRYVPNTDHSLDTDAYDGGINFEEAVIDGDSLPQFTWAVSNFGTEITLNTVTTPTSVTMWQATNTTNRDFRLETFGANWTSSTLTDQGNGTYIAQVTPPAMGATDFFIQMQYNVNGVPLTFTTQISTIPLLTPSVTAIDPGGAYNGSPNAATGTATGLAGLSVSGTFSFTYYAGNSATGTPLPAAPTQAGTYTVVANFTTSDPDYSNGHSDPLTFAIGQVTPTVVAQDDSGPFNGNPFVATAVATGIGAVTVNGTSSFTYYVGTSASGPGSTTAPTDTGTYTVVAAFASSDPNYGNTTSAPVTFTINPATPTVLAIDNGGTYSGSPFAATAAAIGVGGASVNGNPEFTYYPGTVTAGSLYSKIVAFGDSLSDTGNDYILSNETSPPPPYYDGRFSNGPNWIDQLANLLGVADPQPSLSGGTDYAYGGATAGSTYQGVPDLGEQIQTYLQSSPQADSKALYTVWAGANDFFYGQTDPLLVANSVDAALTSLIHAGAQHILVSNLPPQGATPLLLAEGPAASAAIDALDVEFNADLAADAQALRAANPGVTLDLLDLYSLTNALVANPAGFGFTDITDEGINAPAGTDLSHYLFWDDAHPTTAADALIADAAFSAVPEPTLLASGNGSSTAPTNAGTYTVVAAFTSSNSDYGNAQSAPVTFTIGQALPTVLATDAGGTFNGNPSPASATATGVDGATVSGSFVFDYYVGSAATGTPTTTAPTSAGSYSVVASFASNDPDYASGQSAPLPFTISPATPVLALTDNGGLYNDTSDPATATIAGLVSGVDNTPGSSLEGIPVTLTYYTGTTATGTPLSGSPTSAGTYTVEASFAGSTDYISVSKSVTFFISQDRPVITVTDSGGSYNDTPYPATATIAGVVTGVDNAPGSSLEGVPVTLTYYAGSTDTGTPLSGPPTSAGTYTVVASFAGSTDYIGVSKSVGFFITQDRPVITLTDAGGSYNDTLYPATATIAGVVSGVDNTAGSSLEGVPVTLTYYTGSTDTGTPLSGPPTSAGTYTVVASFAGSTDYIGVSKSVGFFITQDRPTITLTDAGGSYNDTPYPATATIAGVVSGVDNTAGTSLESVPVTLSYYSGSTTTGTPLSGPPTSAGTYTVEASFAGSQDYIGATKSVTFVVTQDQPVITLSDAGGPYNGVSYPATATIAGVVSGVDSTAGSSLESVPVTLSYYSGSTTTGTPLSGPPTTAGTYTAVASFAGSQDYVGFSKSVIFVITQDQPVITLTDNGGPYTGTPYPATATIAGVVSGVDNTLGSSLEGVPLTLTYYAGNTASGTPLSGPPSGAGTYTVLASFAGSQDYAELNTSVPFTITAATPTVTANDAAGTYNGDAFPASGSATGIGGATVTGSFSFTYYVGNSVSGNGSSTAPTNAGTYTVVASFTSANSDYSNSSSGPTNFVIGQATPMIKVTDTGGPGTGQSYPASATATGVGGASVAGTFAFTYYVGSSVSGNESSTPPSSPGTYTVTASFTSSDSNYTNASGGPVTFSITSGGPAITAPKSASVSENGSLVCSTANANAISVSDSAAGTKSEQLTLTVTHGKLTLASTKGLTISAGANGSASLTVKGTLANVNAALNGLKFTPTAGYFGSASLTIAYKDLGTGQTVSASVVLTVNPPASQPTVTIKNLFPLVVPGQPVPLLLLVSDTNATAQAVAFTFALSFGDGDSATFSSKSPMIVNHVYATTGTFTVSVTATDEFGHASAAATTTVKVLPVAVETDPFNSSQTALFVGTSRTETIDFTASGKSGIAVTLGGVNEGVFTTSGPLLIFGQGGKDTVKEAPGLKNSLYLLESPTADNIEADMEKESILWAGLTAAVEILNA